jgi:hypothetical protein
MIDETLALRPTFKRQREHIAENGWVRRSRQGRGGENGLHQGLLPGVGTVAALQFDLFDVASLILGQAHLAAKQVCGVRDSGTERRYS